MKDTTTASQIVPPHSVEAEQSAIAAMLLDAGALESVAGLVTAQDFYRSEHQLIFQTIVDMDGRRVAVDMTTLHSELVSLGRLEAAGGLPYIAGLFDVLPTAANALYYAQIVLDKSLLRSMQIFYDRGARALVSGGGNAFALLQSAQKDICALGHHRGVNDLLPLSQFVGAVYSEAETNAAAGGLPIGLQTGFTALDDRTGGLSNTDLIIIAARPSMGKCLGRDTPVMMIDGTSRPVQDIRPGDTLAGPGMAPRRVLGTTSGFGPLFRVTPAKGMPYVVNESHVLSLRLGGTKNKTHHKGDILNVSVKDYFGLPVRIRHAAKGWRSHFEAPETSVPLDPYFIGLWLGDGTSMKPALTTVEPEVVHFLRGFAAGYGMGLREEKISYCISTGQRGGVMRGRNPVLSAMQSLNLMGNKHIPLCYKMNSRRVRLEVMAGIIDTDGYMVPGSNCYELITVSKQLADDYLWLARSLGFAAYKSVSIKTIQSTGYSGNYWRIFVSGHIDEVPVRLARKQAKARVKNRDVTNVGITVTPIGDGEYFGFEVDGDHLFLLGDFTVTHNSALVLAMADHVTRLQKKPVALFSLEMSSGQVATRLMSSLTGIDSNALRCGKMNISEWAKLADASAELYEAPLRIDDSLDSGIQGMRSRCRRMMADGGLSLVVVDYLQLMAPEGRQENRNQEVAKISRELKAMARELRVPVIALSQLSRTVESRADKRPLLSDLRDSGAIEQDADMIIFLYNDAYYNSANVYGYEQDGRPAPQEVEIIVAKNRNGWTGTVRLGFVKPFARFQNILE